MGLMCPWLLSNFVPELRGPESANDVAGSNRQVGNNNAQSQTPRVTNIAPPVQQSGSNQVASLNQRFEFSQNL